ncbi:MAG: hypothetical protein LBV12_06385 [Puniceicoccales bacterium]|jgi:hypothetical protein|nr:hypothetical protein [Puniceicoccales bacterium]
MVFLQKRIAELLQGIPEIQGVPVYTEDKADLSFLIASEISKNTALCVAIQTSRGNESESAMGVGLINETIVISFFASMLADKAKPLLPIIESAIYAIHEAPGQPSNVATDSCFRVTGHDAIATPVGTAGHSITAEILWAFESRN